MDSLVDLRCPQWIQLSERKKDPSRHTPIAGIHNMGCVKIRITWKYRDLGMTRETISVKNKLEVRQHTFRHPFDHECCENPGLDSRKIKALEVGLLLQYRSRMRMLRVPSRKNTMLILHENFGIYL